MEVAFRIRKLARYASRKPIVMKSWYRLTIVPRTSAGETSEMYTGETIDTMPMPKPPMMRNITNCVKSAHRAQPIADMENSTALMNMVFLRPRKSLSIPAHRTPIIEPIRAQPTYQPSRPVDSPNCVLTISVVPEITAVS